MLLGLFCALAIFANGFKAFVCGAGETNKYAVHGRALAPNGQPAQMAKVKRDGVGLSSGRGWGWENEGWPDEVLTDTNGEFTFQRDKAFAEIQVRINASNCAPAMQWLPVSNGVQTIQLSTGAMIRGRILNRNQPLANVRVGIEAQERNSEVFAGYYYANTDTNGEFEFPHLQADTAWNVYGVISSFKPYGCLEPQPVKTQGDGTTNVLADLSVRPGLHLSGTIKTRNGQPLPNGLRVHVGDDRAWDNEIAQLDTNTGHFELTELYAGTARIYLQLNGWRLTGRNRSVDLYNPGSLRGLLDKDKDDLQIEIEPGVARFFSGAMNGQLPYSDQPDHRPLEGCENSAGLIVLSGQVVDDKTGQPLQSFQVVPGYKPPHVATTPPPGPTSVVDKILEPLKKKTVPWNEAPFWNHSRTEVFSNGAFSAEYIPLTSQPLLRIEADGYDPYESDPIPTSTTNLVIRLKKGVGPSGVVLQPDGKPAGGATVIFAASREQCALNGSALSDYSSREDKSDGFRTTGKDGVFSFPARPGGQMLFASHTSGWAQETVANGADGLKLRLKPWAVVRGTLVYGSAPTATIAFPGTPATPPVAHTNGTPAAGIELHLSMPMNNFQQGIPFVNTELFATTDAQGHFAFSGVPPVRLDLVRVVRSPGFNGWSSAMQTWLVAEPGTTNDLGNITFDTPPPLPFTEQVKQKLGL